MKTVQSTASRKTTAPTWNEYFTVSGMPLAVFPVDAELAEHERQRVREARADADEQRLHHEAGRALRRVQLVGDERAERLHRDVDRRIEHPEQARGHPERRGRRHEEQRDRREDRPDEEVRAAGGRADPRCGRSARRRSAARAGRSSARRARAAAPGRGGRRAARRRPTCWRAAAPSRTGCRGSRSSC